MKRNLYMLGFLLLMAADCGDAPPIVPANATAMGVAGGTITR